MKSTIHELKNIKTKFLSKNFILITIAIISMMACKKEETATLTFLDEIDGKQFSKTEILISVDSTTNNPADTVPNILSVLDDCKKDNIWSFNKTAKTFKLDEGLTKCNISDPQVKEQGVIELIDNGTSLRVAGTGTNEIWNIESRTANSFRASYFAKKIANETVKFRVTFTKL